MENITVHIGERTIPLRFTMRQFVRIEEEIGNLGDVRELILKGQHRIRNVIGMIRILGNAGLEHDGQEPDLTEEWLLDSMDPHALMAYQLAVIACMSRDTESQAAQEENESTERDLVLEEIEGKKEQVNSHSGG